MFRQHCGKVALHHWRLMLRQHSGNVVWTLWPHCSPKLGTSVETMLPECCVNVVAVLLSYIGVVHWANVQTTLCEHWSNVAPQHCGTIISQCCVPMLVPNIVPMLVPNLVPVLLLNIILGCLGSRMTVAYNYKLLIRLHHQQASLHSFLNNTVYHSS